MSYTIIYSLLLTAALLFSLYLFLEKGGTTGHQVLALTVVVLVITQIAQLRFADEHRRSDSQIASCESNHVIASQR